MNKANRKFRCTSLDQQIPLPQLEEHGVIVLHRSDVDAPASTMCGMVGHPEVGKDELGLVFGHGGCDFIEDLVVVLVKRLA